MNIVVLYNPTHIYHNMKGSPENPERIEMIYRYLSKTLSDRISFQNVREPADIEDVLSVHTEPYLEFLERMSMRRQAYLGDSTYLNKYSYMAALIAAEASIRAGDEVLSAYYDFAYALIRPPGHHASADMYGGFCLLNNGAIAARHLLDKGIKKIAIIDWDAHAANGTMKIFYSDPNVLLISIHRDPSDYYPHEGFIHQIGRGEGTGYTINIPVPAGAGDNEYKFIFDEIITPVISDYDPGFIIVENGFDPHYSHREIGLTLTTQGFVNMINNVKAYKKMFIMIQEGGYTKYNAKIAHAMLSSLLGMNYNEDDSVDMTERLLHGEKVWSKVNDIIKKLKYILSDYYNLR